MLYRRAIQLQLRKKTMIKPWILLHRNTVIVQILSKEVIYLLCIYKILVTAVKSVRKTI